MSGNYPAGVTDADPYFDMPSVGDNDDDQPTCVNCADPADTERERDDGTIISLCSECASEPTSIPCSRCGKPTTFDLTYGDLCGSCCRAANE